MPEIEPRTKGALYQLGNICMHPLTYFILKWLYTLNVQVSVIPLPALVLGLSHCGHVCYRNIFQGFCNFLDSRILNVPQTRTVLLLQNLEEMN